MNVWILSNQDAGRSLSDDTLRELVQQAGHTIVDLVTKASLDERPLHGSVDLVVAAGGDGTVKLGARLVAGTTTPLAILPLGTANNIATSLGLKSDVPQLISAWHRGRRTAIDAGHARTESKGWFVLEGVGGGLLPAGIAAAQRAFQTADAHPAVEVATAVRLFYDVLTDLEPVRRRIAIDGRIIDKDLLLFEVLNMRSVGPNLVVAPDANPADGLFDIIIAEPAHRGELLAYLESRMEERDARLTLPCLRAKRAHVEACEELHIDDERVETCESGGIEISVTAGAVTLLI